MKLAIFTFLSLFFYSCGAQKGNNWQELDEDQYEVLTAFLNQEFNNRDSFYLNKNGFQLEYSDRFESNYKILEEKYHESDSICKNSSDSNVLKEKCIEAFNYEKFIQLFEVNDFNYFKENYSHSNKKKYIINIKKIPRLAPTILAHSDEYYSINNLELKELPSLKIHGFYFSQNNEYALLAYTLLPWSLRYNIKYAILERKNNMWWHYIGAIRL